MRLELTHTARLTLFELEKWVVNYIKSNRAILAFIHKKTPKIHLNFHALFFKRKKRHFDNAQHIISLCMFDRQCGTNSIKVSSKELKRNGVNLIGKWLRVTLCLFFFFHSLLYCIYMNRWMLDNISDSKLLNTQKCFIWNFNLLNETSSLNIGMKKIAFFPHTYFFFDFLILLCPEFLWLLLLSCIHISTIPSA